MPATISHSLSMTTPNDPAYENQPQHWNQPHAFTINATGSEISNAFSNANGLSFGLSAGAITGSYTVPSVPSVTEYFSRTNTTFNGANISGSITNNTNGLQISLSVAPGGGGADGYNIIAAGTQTANTTGTVVFSNSNGLTFGMSNNSVVTASYTVPTQSNQTGGVYHVGNTTGQSSSSTYDLRTLSFDGAGIVSVGWSAGSIRVSATQSNQAFSAGAASSTFQTLIFQDSNGISFSNNAGSIRASYTRNVVSNAIQAVGSASNSGTNTSRFAADDHVHAGVFSIGVSTAGNTIGDTRVDVGRFVLQGGNNVTLSQITAANALNTIIISGGAAGGADGINAFVVNGGVSTASTTITLSNSNNVSFGHAGGVITATATFAQTNQSAIRGFGVSNTGQTAGNTGISTGIDWVLAGSQSITLSQSTAGGGPNTVWVQHPAWLTTAMASNAVTLSNIRVSAGTTSNLLSALTFNDANGISFGINASTVTASHNGLTSQSNQNVTAANGGFAFQTLSFSNLNGISFGTSAGSAITASHNALTTARASNDAIGLNTAQTNVTWTVNSSGLSLNAAGYAGTGTSATNASITLNSNGLAISVGAGGGVTPVASASNGSFSFTTLGFSNANNVTFGTSAGSIITASVAAPGAAAENNWVHLLGANTAGNTTASGTTIGYSGINLTLSGTNGSVVNISAPATSSLVGTNGVSISTNGSTISVIGAVGSYFQNIPFHWSAIQSTSYVQSTSMVQPLEIPEVLSIGRMRFLRTVLAGATSVATVANTSWGFTQNHTHNFVFYTRGTGASSLSLMSYTSTSFGLSMTIQGSNGAASNNLSVLRSISAPMSSGHSQFTFSTAPAGSASLPFATTDMSNFISGLRLHDSKFDASFNPGLHYLVHGISTAGTTGGATAASALTACTINFGALMIIGLNSNIASFGTSAQSFNHALAGLAGSFSTAGGGTTAAIGSITNFSSIASNPMIYVMMDRVA